MFLRPVVVVALLAASVANDAAGEKNRYGSTQIRLSGGPGMAVLRAVLGAQQRLAGAECSGVLSDFASADSQQPLDAILAERGQAPNDYLGTLVFQDGSGGRACASGKVFAGTRPGSRVVHICARSFQRLVERDPLLAEAIIIHEMLHTLGLGEDPPTSQEITMRVLERCLRRPRRTTGNALEQRPVPPSEER